MVQQLQWEPLQVRVRRVKIRLVHLYKIQHGLVAIPAETYLVAGDTRTREEHEFRPPNVRKDVYKYSMVIYYKMTIKISLLLLLLLLPGTEMTLHRALYSGTCCVQDLKTHRVLCAIKKD
jgi:hypothetical protein